MKRIRYIEAIFQKDPQTNCYTSNALLLQYLLEYATVVNKSKFKKSELYNWVIRNDPKYVEYYSGSSRRNTPYSKRVHDHKETLDTNFEILLQLRLVRVAGIGPADKIPATVKLFEHTNGGLLIKLILRSMDLKEVMATTRNQDKINEYNEQLKEIYQEIYNLITLTLGKKESPASNIFYFKLYQKCKERGIFHKVVERIHHIIISNNGITGITGLLYRAMNAFDIFDKRLEADLLDTIYETINELDGQVKKLFLYRMKMFTENNFENRLENTGTDLDSKEYEEFRFNLRGDYEQIAIRSYCENCKSNQNIALHYLDLISPTTHDNMAAKCSTCNTTIGLQNHDSNNAFFKLEL
jgi:hypothetical protein